MGSKFPQPPPTDGKTAKPSAPPPKTKRGTNMPVKAEYAQFFEVEDLLDLVQADGSIHDLDQFDQDNMQTTLGAVLCGLMKRLERAESEVKRLRGQRGGGEMSSQAQVIGLPKMKTWDDYEAGCLASFGGGHRSDGHLEAFQHGMQTVFALLKAEFPPAEACKAAAESHDWMCGCGWWNGCNLATCAQCGRAPSAVRP